MKNRYVMKCRTCPRCGRTRPQKYFLTHNRNYRKYCAHCYIRKTLLEGQAYSTGRLLCSKCWQVKSKSEFSKDKHTKSGYRSNCKKCDSLRELDHCIKIVNDDSSKS